MKRGIVRVCWLAAGIVFTGLAFVGVVLPLVPTTPFLLLAAFCFARSSERLRAWLYEHPLFGPLLNDWQNYGAINRRTKWIAVTMLAVTPIASFFLGAKWYVLTIQIPVVFASGVFIMTRPDGPPPGASDD